MQHFYGSNNRNQRLIVLFLRLSGERRFFFNRREVKLHVQRERECQKIMSLKSHVLSIREVTIVHVVYVRARKRHA